MGVEWGMTQAEIADEIVKLLQRAKAEAWDEGHKANRKREPDGCRCGAWSDGECACGRYGRGKIITPNPYREGK